MDTAAPERARRVSLSVCFETAAEVALTVSVLFAFAPTFVKLASGPWRTEQEGHGPFIILAAAWLAWRAVAGVEIPPRAPAPVAGWLLLLSGLAALVVTRSQDVTMLEVAAQIPIVAGCVLLSRGWGVLRLLAFPILFLAFSIPPPGWMIDTLTVPLKTMISDLVAQLLYELGYPIAQNGVMIMVGSQEMMVKDACAGMNSIFALSAIGVFYIHEFARGSKPRMVILALAIVPVAVAANFVRVAALVLAGYYFGPDAIEGAAHDLAGVSLFVFSLLLFFALDALIVRMQALFGRSGLVRERRSSTRPSL